MIVFCGVFCCRGMAAIDTGFEDCYSSALQVLSETNIMVLPEMNEMPIYAFAYYFDIAVEAKLIGKDTLVFSCLKIIFMLFFPFTDSYR